MASILAFAGSNASNSINYQLVLHTASLINAHKVRTLNMAHYPFPMYSVDLEKNSGFSNSMIELKKDIEQTNGLVLSVNEHNSSPSAFFKNLIDWLSRVDRKFLQDKKVFLMSTSPGQRGGVSALENVAALLPRFGAAVISTFSLPNFNNTFKKEEGIVEAKLATAHQEALKTFLESL